MKNIDPDRWALIEKILDEALDMEIAERDAFVREACGDDTDLRDNVLKMLEASAESDDFLEGSPRADLENALAHMASVVGDKESDEDDEDLQRAGPYRLIRKLGRGGMGQVYLAVRDDEAFKRYVAVKVIRRGMDTEDILKRFRVERQILAALTHPGIARLLDGGATDEGVSYFVMEYVDGDSITKYCDDNRLSLEARLELFCKVCAAVHFAHQNLIVHRDLKPANILVTTDGQVKLLDFGIAKFLNPDLAGYTLPMTRTEVRVMTPEYASPEQVRGNSVTTASDVYQLGILLYELLTGHRPFSFETVKRGEIEKIILEKAPERPSTMITVVEEVPKGKEKLTPESVSLNRRTPLERLRKQLSGDLDHIILMALRKETDRRYQSADQLLKDIQNYQTGRPVSAQPDTFTYRTNKFIRRNKIVVAGALAMFAVLFVATIVSIGFAVEATEQRDRFEAEAQKLAGVVGFVIDLFESANPEQAQGRDLTVREMVDVGAASVMRDLQAQPEVQSEMMRVLSLVYAELGEADAGMNLIEPALQIQIDLSDGADSASLARALYAMAVLKDDVGETDESIGLHREALAMRRRMFGEVNLDVAQSLNDLGVSMYSGYRNLKSDTIQTVWEQSLAIRLTLLGDSHRDVAESLANLGAVYGDLYYESTFENDKYFQEAENFFRRALEMMRGERGENHPIYVSSLHNYGTLLMDKGALQEAALRFEEAVEKKTYIYGPRHWKTANSINWEGRVREQQGRMDEAEALYRESLDIHKESLGPENWFVGADYHQLGNFILNKGDTDEAVALLLEALRIFQGNPGRDASRTRSLNRTLGRTLEGLGRVTESERYYLLVLDRIDPETGISSGSEAQDNLNVGRVLIANGKSGAAREYLLWAKEYYLSEQEPDAEAIEVIDALLSRAN